MLITMTVGRKPFLRYVIHDDTTKLWWDGHCFIKDLKDSKKYLRFCEAALDIQNMLREQYNQLPKSTYTVPIDIEVYGNADLADIQNYLYQATDLVMKIDEFGVGPNETLVTTTIYWHKMKKCDDESLLKLIEPNTNEV
jgi:hypothetical protein